MPLPKLLEKYAHFEGMIFYDNLEDAFLGIGYRCGEEPIAVYDMHKVLEVLMSQDMTREEAQENMDFNILGQWVGDQTPLFLEIDDEYAHKRP